MFLSQMELADACGIRYIVTHLGSHLDAGEVEGFEGIER